MSKGAVLVFLCEFGVEFARCGVRVNALCLGLVDTLLLCELYVVDFVKVACWFVHLLMGCFVVVVEIVNVVLFLVSDELFYIIVFIFLVDGGLLGVYVMLE